MNKSEKLSSVQNSLRILNSFNINIPQKRVIDISKELDLPKSTVSRLLQTLLYEGYVKKDEETQKYSLGAKVLSLYSSFIANTEVVKEAHPIIEELAKETSESIQLAQRENTLVIYLDQVKSNFPIQIYSHIGVTNPIHCTSSGKILLAYEDSNVIEETISKMDLKKYTKYTITDPNIFLLELEKVKKEGYSYSANEFLDEVAAISAPIKDYSNKVIAAISLVGPTQRITGNKLNIYINKVINAAKKISKNMGYKY